MDSILGQAIIAELAAEYNSTITYLEIIPSPLDEIHAFRHISADRNNALEQLAALRNAMQIVARQTHVNLILPK